jgi:uncharacterized protein (DUF736 family)
MEYDNTNSGVLFKNDRKETERHPDYTGTWTDANGVEHWFSAWIKDSKSGTKFMSVSARPKNDQPAPQPRDYAADVKQDDVPFN